MQNLYDNALKQAAKQACYAKPFILKRDNTVYTGVFNHNEWVYDIFEDGFFMMKINMKQASKAKAYLQQWLNS